MLTSCQDPRKGRWAALEGRCARRTPKARLARSTHQAESAVARGGAGAQTDGAREGEGAKRAPNKHGPQNNLEPKSLVGRGCAAAALRAVHMVQAQSGTLRRPDALSALYNGPSAMAHESSDRITPSHLALKDSRYAEAKRHKKQMNPAVTAW